MIELYESQRAMRAMRRAALQKGVVALLDVGSSKISCFVLRFHGARAPQQDGIGSMAGQAGFQIIGAHTTQSHGVRQGEIVSMHETERAIRTVVKEAIIDSGVRVDHVIACFAGAEPRSDWLEGTIEIGGEAVEDRDVARVLSACEPPELEDGREVLHAQPINFAIDQRSGFSDPRGQIARNLSADMHMLTIDAQTVQNLAYCVKRCDLELAGLASSAYVSGVAALVEDEQEMGAACIDMGAGATGISIFLKKHMIYADAVPMGGDSVTWDLSYCFNIDQARAERIKTLHGGVVATSIDDGEMIPIGGQTGDWETDRRQVSRAQVIGIMRPRVDEILEAVRNRLEAAGFFELPSRRIVLTGGGSQIPGLDDMAERVFGQPVRFGLPQRVPGLKVPHTGPEYASAVGLCLFAANPQDEWWDFEIPADRYPARSLKRVVNWFRDNW